MADIVAYYDTGYPDVLRPPKEVLSENRTAAFHTYFIRYTVVQKGQYPFLAPSTEFLLLNHFKLDQEVANNLLVKLCLPHNECINASFKAGGIIALDEEQVLSMKEFNTSLFKVVLKRGSTSQKSLKLVENEAKGYYVLPLKSGLDSFCKATIELIDWHTARSLVSYERNAISCTVTWPIENMEIGIWKHNLLERKSLRLRSGYYEQEELIDALVTYGPGNVPCFIVGISRELTGLSVIEGLDGCTTYSDFWMNRFEFEFNYAAQPLLVGYTLSRAGNFLQRPSGQQEMWCSTKVRRIMLPPEVCILHPGVKGCLWRGAFRLPSVLCALENSLLAVQIRDSIGVPISAFKVQESLTCGAYNTYLKYERLELLGDSFLTFICAAALFLNDVSLDRVYLGDTVHEIVKNKKLFQYAKTCGLAFYVLNEPFHAREWIPPGPIAEDVKARLDSTQKQRISQKTLADVVEALIGSYILNGSTIDSLKVVSWLKVPIQYPISSAESKTLCLKIAATQKTKSLSFDISNLEMKLKYSFQSCEFVSMALAYNCEDPEGGLNFGRLAYLGDSLLSFFVTRHLVTTYESLDVGNMNLIKQSIINKENLACIAAKFELDEFLPGISSSERESILLFKAKLHKERQGGKPIPAYGFSGLYAPKVLGDTVSTLTAAVFLDSNLDTETVWKILRQILGPLPDPGSFQLHPVDELRQYCDKRSLSLDIQCSLESGVYSAYALVDKVILGCGEHELKTVARKFAAQKALDQLSKHQGSD